MPFFGYRYQNSDDFRGLENRDIAHESSDGNVVNSDELRLELRFSILQKHADDFLKIAIELAGRD